MQAPRFSPKISLIEMAPCPAPHSGFLGRPALPCLSSQTDTAVALIYRIYTYKPLLGEYLFWNIPAGTGSRVQSWLLVGRRQVYIPSFEIWMVLVWSSYQISLKFFILGSYWYQFLKKKFMPCRYWWYCDQKTRVQRILQTHTLSTTDPA